MSQLQENDPTEDRVGDGGAAASQPSAACQEAVTNMSRPHGSDKNFYGRVSNAVTALFDLANPVLIASSDNLKRQNDSTEKKSTDSGTENRIDKVNHNDEVSSILENADLILSTRYRSLAELGSKTSSITSGDQGQIDTRSKQQALTPKEFRHSETQKPEHIGKAEEARQANLQEANLKALATELEQRLLANLNKQIDRQDLPKQITSAAEAKQFIEFARQDNQKVVMDFSTAGCGWCTKMHNETYPSIDQSKIVVMHINASDLTDGMDAFTSELHIKGNISQFPYTAVLGPGNDYGTAQQEQAGFMDSGQLLTMIRQVR